MPLFKIFDSFPEYLAEGKIDLQTHALKIVLTNVAPIRGNAFYSDLTEIAAGGGYATGGRAVTVYSSFQLLGAYKLVLNDLTMVATGGAIGPFRYAVLVDTTPTAPPKPLIGWWDLGASTTVAIGGTITFDFSTAVGILQILTGVIPTTPPDETAIGLTWGSDGLFWGSDTLIWGEDAAADGVLGWANDNIMWGADALSWG
jgi:hypothetical protein